MKTDIDWENDKSRIEHPCILVVDDDPLILRHLNLLLSRKGCVVSVAHSGQDALRQSIENPPDAVLLDVMMPDMDGYEVCRRMKAEPTLQHVPVLLITALNDVFNKVKGLDAGADDFISKPVNEAELRARLWAHLRNKRLHDQLEASYRRLKELESMKEALTYMIMHDLSAPLTAVHFGLEAVLDAIGKGEGLTVAHKRMLQTSMSGCRRVIDMLRDVLVVQRLEEKNFPLQTTLINLQQMAVGCLTMLEPSRIAAGVSIKMEIASDIPNIRGDEMLLSRVLTNLITNALKFTARDGHVVVGFRRYMNDEVEGFVKDDGIGIPSDYLSRIFDKYVQAEGHHVRNGLGLGLTFCRYAIEAHNGCIWAQNNSDNGSCFTFRLPIESPALLVKDSKQLDKSPLSI